MLANRLGFNPFLDRDKGTETDHSFFDFDFAIGFLEDFRHLKESIPSSKKQWRSISNANSRSRETAIHPSYQSSSQMNRKELALFGLSMTHRTRDAGASRESYYLFTTASFGLSLRNERATHNESQRVRGIRTC